MLKEKQEKDLKEQKQAKFMDDLEKNNTKFQETIRFLNHLAEDDLNNKISVIQSLANASLLAEAKKYRESIRKEVADVKTFVQTNIDGSRQMTASDFSEKEMSDFLNDLKDNLMKFIKNSQDFENILKKFNQSIEAALNLKITKEKELKVSILIVRIKLGRILKTFL